MACHNDGDSPAGVPWHEGTHTLLRDLEAQGCNPVADYSAFETSAICLCKKWPYVDWPVYQMLGWTGRVLNNRTVLQAKERNLKIRRTFSTLACKELQLQEQRVRFVAAVRQGHASGARWTSPRRVPLHQICQAASFHRTHRIHPVCCGNGCHGVRLLQGAPAIQPACARICVCGKRPCLMHDRLHGSLAGLVSADSIPAPLQLP